MLNIRVLNMGGDVYVCVSIVWICCCYIHAYVDISSDSLHKQDLFLTYLLFVA